MKGLIHWVRTREFWSDTQGQDLIEYALMAGFVALAAGAVMPGLTASITTLFGKIGSILSTTVS
jgi:pilus assembly protein Flp/PilA